MTSKEGGNEAAGRRRGEEVGLLQLPRQPDGGTCHSAGDGSFGMWLEGLTSIRKGQRQSHWNNDEGQK